MLSSSRERRVPRIVVIGSANADLVARTPRLPGPGETVTGSTFAMVPGGKSANQAVAAARLGADVHFIGRVGTDLFGDSLEASFLAAGVNVEHLIRDQSTPTGTALISVSEATGENCIIVVAGANGNLSSEDIEKRVDLISSADAVILALEVPTRAVEMAIEIAKSSGVRVVLNPAPATILPEELLQLCDILIPNEHEVGILAADSIGPLSAAKRLQKLSGGTIIVTLGAEGALALDHSGAEVRVKAPKATNVVDTTAAGDCYTAAVTVALCEGQELAKAMRFAAQAASISVTRPGAQSSLPTRSEVDSLLSP